MNNLFDDQEEPKETETEISEGNEGFEDDEKPEWNDEFFPFSVEDEYVVTELVKVVRGIIAKKNLSPYQLRQIAVVLYALEHLPRRVEGISIGLSVIYRLNDESTYCDFYISESGFRLTSGGNVYDPTVGGDNFSSTAFELETSGFRSGDGESYEVTGWFNQIHELLEMDGKIEFEDNGDVSEIDWQDEANANGWDELFEMREKMGY